MSLSKRSYRGLHLALFIIATSLLLLAAAAAAFPKLPVFLQKAITFLTSCPYRTLTQSPCPLCGGLTAFDALLHGNLEAARAANPAATAFTPILLLQFPHRLYRMRQPDFSWKEELVFLGIGLALGAGLTLA